MKPHQLYRFDSFCLDATAKVLLKDGQTVAITRKAVETLLALVENSGQVVSKEELLNTIWPDRIVDEANLTQNIAMVRRALAAERGTPAFIETFPGRGYRLLGPVVAETPVELEQPLLEAAAQTFVPVKETTPRQEPALPLRTPPFSFRQRSILVFAIVFLAALSLGRWFYLQKNVSSSEAVFRVSPFTRLPGRELQPALSPDGRKVAFLWDQGTGQPPDIRVQAAGESSSVPVTREAGHYSSPAWSPDGRALAYLRIERLGTEVLLRSLENGGERQVARFTPPNYGFQYRLLAWSPDGQWLAVSHADAPDKPNGLFLVSVATGEKKPLTKPEPMVGGDMDPHFSPDGQTITFIRHIQRSHQELYSIPIGGGQPTPLTAAAKQISGHDWLSNEIVFASNRGGEFRLWKLRAGETEPRAVAIYGEAPIELSLARKAPLLAYSLQQQDRNIWRLDLKDKTWTRIVASSAQDASPQYSPAGDKLCFRSDRSGEEQLWVSDADGGNQTQITKGDLYPSVGHWSPDGRQIVFNNARSGEILLADQTDGKAWTVRATGVSGVHPIFSPDGRWIYAGTTKNLIRFSGGSGAPAEVVKTGGFSLGLSKDGKWLYFVRDANDSVLWRADVETGEFSTALEGLLPNCTSCWALAEDGIYYLGSDKQSFDAQAISFLDFATGKTREIVKYPEPLSPVGSGPFSLSPDRRSLLCVRVDPSNSDIMRVEPFR
ncbi:MAG TPA: winged helix-turn-helix domain-containing protein [Blastocatellia bacterium]|nr:winged helix-turn-helix domain-containing protein [Blastocatellia bacterium]HMX25620.1 winged helix-turn-helix domain-containing protein [Blastocatellia bacterium]HNG34546.1 winged helix-turn-helix domain-containing protein [Blastocatellia bacterium]